MENETPKKLDFQGRKIRGYAILSKGDMPERLGRNVYCVASQSQKGKNYIVFSHPHKWECECPDWQKNEIDCKHIHAIKFWIALKKRIESREVTEVEKTEEKLICKCGSDRVVKAGKVRTSKRQRFICRNCKKTFVADSDFKKFKGNPQVITAVMDLYFKGVSLRKIQDHVKQFYKIELTHVTIYYWIKRFTKIMSKYVENFKPSVSGMWHIDEQMLKVKKKDQWAWCWNVIDSETRFLIANNVTEGRGIPEAREVMKKSKGMEKKPNVIITDGLASYEKAVRREFGRGFEPTEHIKLESLRKQPNNNKVERFHNTFRERDKVIRGFQNPQTAQEWSDGFRLYYNYIRPHSAFNGLTPSEIAGIKLNLHGQNKWEGLLRMSMKDTHLSSK